MAAPGALLFTILTAGVQYTGFDYRPRWSSGTNNTVNAVYFSKTITDQPYRYRVDVDGATLAIQDALPLEADGSQMINFLEYNAGHGIANNSNIRIYAVDPDNGNQYLVGSWTPPN